MELDPFVFHHAGVVVGKRGGVESSHAGEGVEASGLADAVNRFTLRSLQPDEFTVFSLDLCHNQVDRHFSRFPEEELEVVNQLVVGRPLMERHDVRGTLPRGTFFRSQLHRAGERVSVRPDVYVLRTRENEGFILNIEGGVYRETSIGFSFRTPECSICGRDLRTCSHVPGRTYEGKACHYVLRGVLDVIEGSVVASGSQGTGFVPASRGLGLADALAQARRVYHEPIALWSKGLWSAE